MPEIPWTAEQLEGGIGNALAAHDVVAACDFLRLLVVVDARRAERVYRTLMVGLDIAEEAHSAGR